MHSTLSRRTTASICCPNSTHSTKGRIGRVVVNIVVAVVVVAAAVVAAAAVVVML
jgi:hypothetical protein